jgi:hypothetical protein
MFRSLAAGLALALLAPAVPSVAADGKKDKGKDRPTVWTREANGVELKFEFGKDTAKYRVFAGENGCVVTARIKIEKGVVTSDITGVEVTGNFPGAPKKGDKMSFKWVAKGDTATLSDLKGDGTDGAKEIVEGAYTKTK